jgi:Cu2+-exporting ATPase
VARILAHHGAEGLAASDVHAEAGRGVEGIIEGVRYRIGSPEYALEWLPEPASEYAANQGVTQVMLSSSQGPLALFELSDNLRPRAQETVQQLQQAGLQVWLLSGDNSSVVQRVARQLGIQHAYAGLRPEDKLQHIKRLQEQGAVVAMVGDGVNDAPVLAGAQVSLAMGSGTQLAQASADMVLLSEELPHLAEAVQMARATLRVIRQNLGWAVIYNLVALPLAAAGYVAPWMAAIGMSASSLIVVLNALRLNRQYNSQRIHHQAIGPRAIVGHES